MVGFCSTERLLHIISIIKTLIYETQCGFYFWIKCKLVNYFFVLFNIDFQKCEAFDELSQKVDNLTTNDGQNRSIVVNRMYQEKIKALDQEISKKVCCEFFYFDFCCSVIFVNSWICNSITCFIFLFCRIVNYNSIDFHTPLHKFPTLFFSLLK